MQQFGATDPLQIAEAETMYAVFQLGVLGKDINFLKYFFFLKKKP